MVIKTQGQNQIFRNDDNEFISIKDDTIIYRLKNKGCLSYYTYSIGRYKCKGDTIIIKDINYSFTKVNEVENEFISDSLRICIENSNSIPIIYSPVEIKKNDLKINKHTDVNGCFKIGKEEIDIDSLNNFLKLHVDNIFATFEQDIKVKFGYNYLIRLLIGKSLSILNVHSMRRKYLIIKYENNSIEIFDPVVSKFKKFNATELKCKTNTDVFEKLINEE